MKLNMMEASEMAARFANMTEREVILISVSITDNNEFVATYSIAGESTPLILTLEKNGWKYDSCPLDMEGCC
jgi:hypothetical protein